MLAFQTLVFLSTAFAQEAAPPQPPGMGSLFMPIALSFAVIYFLIIMPQNRREKEQRKKLSAVEKGDEVTTKGGLVGKVTNVADKVLTVEIADKVRVRVDREFIHAVAKEKKD